MYLKGLILIAFLELFFFGDFNNLGVIYNDT